MFILHNIQNTIPINIHYRLYIKKNYLLWKTESLTEIFYVCFIEILLVKIYLYIL